MMEESTSILEPSGDHDTLSKLIYQDGVDRSESVSTFPRIGSVDLGLLGAARKAAIRTEEDN